MSALLTRRPYPRTVTGRFTDVTPDPAMAFAVALLGIESPAVAGVWTGEVIRQH